MMHWLVETMVAASLLMVAVLILRRPVMRHFGPRAAYLLWLAPALRMVLPPLPESWIAPASSGAQNVLVVLTGASSLPLPTTIATGGGTVWLWVLSGLWLGGAALFFMQHVLAYWVFTRDIRTDAEPLFAQGRIRVTRSNAVISPIAFGIFAKTVVVPADFIHRFDETEQRLALSHETYHHRRGDLAVNVAALAILSLHWFNPLAHYAHRAFRLDQEAACDDLVLAGSSPAERQAYGTALYKSATGGVPLVACAMGTASQLKTRLQWIVARPERSAPLAGMGLMTLLVLVGLGATASASAPDPFVTAIALPRVAVSGGVVRQAPATTVRKVRVGKAASNAMTPLVVAAPKQAEVRMAAANPPPTPDQRFSPAEPGLQQQARPNQAQLANVNCSDGGTPTVFFHRASTSVGIQNGFAIIICESHAAQNGTLTGGDMINALQSTRAEMANEPMLTDNQRSNIIAAIDLQIGQINAMMEANAEPQPAI